MAAESSGTPEVKTVEENSRKRKRLTAVLDKLTSQVQVERKPSSGSSSTSRSGTLISPQNRLSTGTVSDDGDISPKIHVGASTTSGAHSWSSLTESCASGDEGSISERSPFSPSGESISSVSDTPVAGGSGGTEVEENIEFQSKNDENKSKAESVKSKSNQSTLPEVFRFDSVAQNSLLKHSVSDEDVFVETLSEKVVVPPSDNRTPPIAEFLQELGVRSPKTVRTSLPATPSTMTSSTKDTVTFSKTTPLVSVEEMGKTKVVKEGHFRKSSPSTPIFELPRIVKVSKSLTVPLKCQRLSTNILSPPSYTVVCSCPTCTPLISITTTAKPIESHPPLWLEAAAASEQFLAGGVPMSPVSPLTPNTPLSPVSHTFLEHYFHSKYLPDLYRRRSHSDGDLQHWASIESADQRLVTSTLTSTSAAVTSTLTAAAVLAATTLTTTRSGRPIPKPLFIPSLRKGGSLESDQSTPQDSPLDLSMKFCSMSRGNSPRRRRRNRRERRSSSISSESGPGTPFLTPSSEASPLGKGTFELSMVSPRLSPLARGGLGDRDKSSSSLLSVPMMKGDVTSPTLKESLAVQYNMDVSPVVEEMPPGADVAYVCPVCGQMFSLHDRLAKHMASRHKTRLQSESSAKCYLCEVCKRSFARSDMLTRHMRLHTGLKPYTCQVCGQVFSRSDHLSTHQRTHTGEKPYRCPQCPYAACRRDMITRHMRTHARYDLPEGAGGPDAIPGESLPKDLSVSTPNLSNKEESIADVVEQTESPRKSGKKKSSPSTSKKNLKVEPIADD